MYINKKQRTICNICSYNLANCCTCRNIAFIKNLMTYALKLKVPDMICVLHLGNWGPKKKMICFFVKFRHPFLFEEAGLMSLSSRAHGVMVRALAWVAAHPGSILATSECFLGLSSIGWLDGSRHYNCLVYLFRKCSFKKCNPCCLIP